ncbi:protein-tyrosine-phosphatase PTP1-like [Varroa destructor]|uniref:protein-tyrosine-phosphatase n=1 Tax=Varroa destructor TaxID=109461 RepID=A0A7M7JMF0_VARDE|nr:protein-tyrosine-phosphatase PTP1-like [Varroa destructor]
MAIEIGRKALSKLSCFLSSAKISRCASPPQSPRDDPAAGGLGVRGGQTVAALSMEAEFDEIERAGDWQKKYVDLRLQSTPNPNPLAAESGVLFAEAKKLDNRKLNRYTDVLAFEHSRVVLSRGDVDYINANHLVYERARRSYILTQGPLPETVGHFWLMVWEQRAPVIIMLNKIIEKQRLKCHKYWPDSDEPLDIEELELSVELLSEDETDSYIRRTMRLADGKSGDSRDVIQFQYTEWPDFGVPNSPDDFLEFLELVRGSGLLSGSEGDKEKGPPVIHCSAGIGRSGTFCLVDLVLKMLEDGTVKDNGDINVQHILLELRRDRVGLIQTHEQLRFAYQALIEASKRQRGESTSSAFRSRTSSAGGKSSHITSGSKDVKEPMETEQTGCNGDVRHRVGGRRSRPGDADENDENRKIVTVGTSQDFVVGAEQNDVVDEDNIVLPTTAAVAAIVARDNSGSRISKTAATNDRTAKIDGEAAVERTCSSSTSSSSSSSSSEHMNTNGPELDVETMQEKAGEQRDEELQTEAEEGGEEEEGAASDGSGAEDEASSPQKRAHHRLSLNNSDSKEEPILKRTRSQDE